MIPVCTIASFLGVVAIDESESLLQATQSAEISVDGDVEVPKTLDIDSDDVRMLQAAEISGRGGVEVVNLPASRSAASFCRANPAVDATSYTHTRSGFGGYCRKSGFVSKEKCWDDPHLEDQLKPPTTVAIQFREGSCDFYRLSGEAPSDCPDGYHAGRGTDQTWYFLEPHGRSWNVHCKIFEPWWQSPNDCSGKDLWLWLGDHREQATAHNEHLWVKQNTSEFSSGTAFYAQTKGKNCNEWCSTEGYGQCVRGMDDAHHQSSYAENHLEDGSKCTIFPSGHDRKRQDEAGCRQRWQTQMCACAMPQDLELNPGCPPKHEDDDTILIRVCDVLAANPNDPYDTTQTVDLLLRDEDGQSNAMVVVGDAGNLLITSPSCDTIFTPSLTVDDGPKTGHELVLPPSFSFFVQVTLEVGQNITFTEPSVLMDPSQSAYHEGPVEIEINFKEPPKFKVCNGGNEQPIALQMRATPNLVSNCLADYTKIEDDKKCPFQHEVRLWRKVDRTLEDCYRFCAATPDCQFFSFDDKSAQWNGTCMGCTSKTMIDGPHHHVDFKFYEVCKRSDVRGYCEQHEEFKCHPTKVLQTLHGKTAQECQQACNPDPEDPAYVPPAIPCDLWASDGNTCQLCKDHYVFKGAGPDSLWAVMGKHCSSTEVEAKFGA